MHVVKHLFKFMEHTTPRVNSNVNYELLITVTCQCMLTNCNKCTTTVGVGVLEESRQVWGWGIWEIYMPSVGFAVDLKMLLKKNKIICKKCVEQNFRNNLIH